MDPAPYGPPNIYVDFIGPNKVVLVNTDKGEDSRESSQQIDGRHLEVLEEGLVYRGIQGGCSVSFPIWGTKKILFYFFKIVNV